MENILAISSFILSVTSVVTVIITIRQNKRILEASTRPYVRIYFDHTQMGEPIGYFVIKNFGNSSAKITSLSYNDVVKGQPTSLCNVTGILDGLVGNSICPNQKFLLPIRPSKSPCGTCTFDISYQSSSKSYTEHIEINIEQYGDLTKPRMGDDDVMRVVAYPLQEIAERLM